MPQAACRSGFRHLARKPERYIAGRYGSATPGPGIVAIADFKFGPETVAVAPNTPITWHNADGSPHQVTITGSKPQRSAVILKGQTAQLSFAEPATYDYICGLHPAMKGKIVSARRTHAGNRILDAFGFE